MNTHNSYVSSKLCHFVGHKEKYCDAQYKILKTIIASGNITAKPNDPSPYMQISLGPSQITENGDLYELLDCVCFCDIPDESLYIHTSKYGKFGLAFRKEFLIESGVNPVMYVPKKSKVEIYSARTSKEHTAYTSLPKLLDDSSDIFTFLECITKLPDVIVNMRKFIKQLWVEYDIHFGRDILNMTQRKLAIYVLAKFLKENDSKIILKKARSLGSVLSHYQGLVKVFDHKLSELEADNYYYEREWRAAHPIKFSIHDIITVYLPSSFVKTFVQDFPDYEGGYYILDE